ncbi:MAG: peptidylprolyl isomerase [Bacteroides sp.]
MATLQNIRSKGPLLVIVIGLALFAFIAGDAWKVLQPHQSQDVGEVNGTAISAQEYQKLVEEFSEVIKLTNNLSSLSDEDNNRVKDQVWQNYVNGKLIEAEAKKLGLTVTKSEIQSIINQGVHPMLAQNPFFRNPQTGLFDADALKNFLVNYTKMKQSSMAQGMESYDRIYNYWQFVEKQLFQSRLMEKYQALLSKALFANSVEAQAAFDARTQQTDLLLAAIPYSSVADSTVKVSDADLKAAYDKKKEQFKQYVETRNIKYIDVQVTASAEDKAALQNEMEEYTAQLPEAADYSTFVRSTGSNVPYVDLFYNKSALPSDVASRLDSVNVGGVYGPYYNVADNTLNSFRKLAVAQMADSIQFRQIIVTAEDAAKTQALADSIFGAIKGGADFAELAKKYGQPGEAQWLTAAAYEGAQLDGDNLKYLQTIIDAPQNALQNVTLAQANLIFQVMAKREVREKVKVAVIKRTVDFSKDTYTKAYNEFSQFIATNNTVEKMMANAEDAGYRVLDRMDLMSSEHTIGGVRGTKEALRWAFGAKVGEVSGLYECGESDHMMVVGVSGITPEGYRPLALVKDQLSFEVIRDKKAEQILASLKAAGVTTIDQVKAQPNAVSDSIKMVTFSAATYVPSLRSSEPLVSAFASVAALQSTSAPIKGNGGVFVLQPYAKNQTAEEYNQDTEEITISNMYQRMASQYLNDLYMKADVKDNRYLYF